MVYRYTRDQLSNSDYHKKIVAYSSSQLKDILESPEIFYRKHITKEIEREESAVFDVGTYFHTSILEPDKARGELAVFRGVRRGKAWDDFQAKNENKTIITEAESVMADRMIESVNSNTEWKKIFKTCNSEYSVVLELYVKGEIILAQLEAGSHLFLEIGLGEWFPVKDAIDLSGFVHLPVKVRADAVDILGGNILDLKSTSGNVKDLRDIQSKISKYAYDLSAMFYCDIFSAACGNEFDFYWVFASKDLGGSKIWKADKACRSVGRAKWTKAIVELARNLKNEWAFEDTITEIGPSYYDREYLNEKKEDLL